MKFVYRGEIMENMVQSKEEMSEEDIKRLFITPVLESKWDRGMITMETKVTDGKIKVSGNIILLLPLLICFQLVQTANSLA